VRLSVVYGLSIAAHLAIGSVVWSLKKPVAKERVSIVVREVKKAQPKPPEPEPPPPPKKTPPRRVATASPKPAPAPARSAPAPAAAPVAAADFGLTMTGGEGPALAMAHPEARPASKKEEARPARPKVLSAGPPDEDEGCPDAPVKPKPVTILQPAYTDDARSAQIEGKVRIEITVGPDGAVTGVRVIQGLGHGLDEAALEAARGSTFEAGTKCGKPVATTFTIGMRFSL
jgi:protein TonB